MKTIGDMDDQGFYLITTYNTKSPFDMEQMMRTLQDNEDAEVKEYHADYVEVIVRPDW